jgi:molecular chaperone HtpG
MGKRKFKTEVQQLLNLVIHSLYSNKDIYLRELISNASDACDRLRFLALSEKGLVDGDIEYKIKLIPNKDENTITIRDNGIGMTAEEVEKNIGTIANSGTRKFLEELESGNVSGSPDLIGQFGVGFYASFMVADEVTVVTRRAGESEGVRWHSAGAGTYTIDTCEKEAHGTDVILHMAEGMGEYLDEWKVRKIVKQFSDFIDYPVVMDKTVDETPSDDEGNPIEGAEKVLTVTEEVLNSMKAIWMRPKSEVTEEQYNDFYKHISHDIAEPIRTIHYAAEGALEFKALLFVQGKAPVDAFSQQDEHGLQLYVKRVFITNECKELMPAYLRFVKGVVESNDLPLNVSREILQENAIIRKIQKTLVTKVLKTLIEMKEKHHDEYISFYKEFGRVLKEGMHFDPLNKEKLEQLILYSSTFTEGESLTSLKEYVDRMPDGQDEIYYLTGDAREAVEHSPFLEAFKSRGYEVLLMTDPIDEWVIQGLTEFDGKKLKAIDRGDIDLGDERSEEEKSAQADEFKDLTEYIKEKLTDDVKDVRLSNRLTDSVACLVADQWGMNAHMERIYRAMNQEMMVSKRILELNPDHAVVKKMAELKAKDSKKSTDRLDDYIELVLGQALLTEGSALKDPTRFTNLVSKLMS